jgi:hypothetical protein
MGQQVETTDLAAWHTKLLPFMMTSLIVMGLLFFALTVWHFRELQAQLTFTTVEVEKVLDRLQREPRGAADAAYRDWYMRVVLEDAALRHRYQQNSAIVHARVWTRYMGFLTGMILALTGCVFVLGKLREEVSVSGSAQGLSANLATSSPGLALALAGAVLVGISLYVQVTVETSDSPVYLPRLVEVAAPPERLKPPAPVTPIATPDAAPPATPAGPPPLPPSLRQKMEQESKAAK